MASRLQEIRNIRIDKLNKLIALGLSGYPAHSQKTVSNQEVVSNFDKYENQVVSLTGRLMALREHGALTFGDLEDESGKLQIFIKDGELAATDASTNTLGFADLSLLDVGDFVQIDGKIIKTKTGAISIAAEAVHLLTKTLRPLPDSWNGLEDKDLMFRRRYLDLTLNRDRRDMFMRKSKFWSVSRAFMLERGFVEVETPVLEHVTGGADAKPFVTHHDALDETFYMRISTELYLKRLIGGGYEKIFTLAPNFRNEGIDDEHLQEYYQLEWYWAYANYRDNMALTVDIFREIAQKVYGTTTFTKGEHTFDLSRDWEEIDFGGIIQEKLGVDIFKDTDEVMIKVLKEHKIKLEPGAGRGRLIDNLWKIIRKTISGPAFLVNEPKFMSPLAKSKPEDDKLTERFHVILAGSELANGYSELNDPQDQLARFLEQQSARDSGDDESQMLDIDYVEMLEYGMPPTSGEAFSERLFWFLEGVTAREGTLFPQMKRHIEPLTREIYGLKEEAPAKKATTPAPVTTTNQTAKSGSVTRDQALAIVKQYVKNENLVKHMLAVEAAMAAYATKLGEDEEQYRIAGLLHDFDWEIHPTAEQHPVLGIPILREQGVDEVVLDAIMGHGNHTGVPRTTNLAKALFAVDELTGLITTTALVRPSKKIADVELKSIQKKWKDKTFAAGVNRQEVEDGAKELGVDLWGEHIPTVLVAMQAVADDLGL